MIVSSYNVHRCIGMDGRHDPDRIAAVIKELQADVIGLQEVDARAQIEHGVDQLAHLMQATGLAGVAGPTLRSHRGHYGNAVLTRHPIRAVRLIDLSVPGREPRGAIDVEVEVDKTRVRIVVTHLGLRAGERRWQMGQLLVALSGHAAPVSIVLGDFNEWLGPARMLRRLDGRFTCRPVRTFPSRTPLLALDWILVRPPEALATVGAHASPLARVASDHRPVRGVIRI